MGYEIHFKYHKKKSEGFGYETDSEPELMKINVGKQWDEIDLDEVAKVVFGQMAKRNVLIVDAEVFEYAKKKISFKLKDDGITLKNRKFSYDITGSIKSENDDIENPSLPVLPEGMHPHQLVQSIPTPIPTPTVPLISQDLSALPPEVQSEIAAMKRQNIQPKDPNQRMRPILPPAGQPLRFEIFDPNPQLLAAAKQRNLPFTVGKKYPIFEEKPDRRGIHYGMLYLTEDNDGNRRAMNDKHFVPEINLTNSFEDDARPNHVRVPVGSSDNSVVIDGRTIVVPDIHTFRRRG